MEPLCGAGAVQAALLGDALQLLEQSWTTWVNMGVVLLLVRCAESDSAVAFRIGGVEPLCGAGAVQVSFLKYDR